MMAGDSIPLDELYQEVILDHFKHPRCKGCLSNPSATSSLFNPLCGDKISVSVLVDEKGIVRELAFVGQGCSISQASASMMSSLCKGKSIEEVKGLAQLFRKMMRGETPEGSAELLGDAVALEGVRKFSARIKCAVLAWEAIEKCLPTMTETPHAH